MTVKRLTQDAIYLALLIVSAYTNVVLPVSEINFTLQILVIFIIAFMLPLSDGMLILVCYFAMGIIGIPVFANGGGFAYVLKPTFGYLLGFVLGPLVAAPFKKLPIKSSLVKNAIGGVVGLIVIYLFGSLYFFLLKNLYLSPDSPIKFATVLKLCVYPYIPFDLLKIVLAVLISYKLLPIINDLNNKQKNQENTDKENN